MFSNNKSQETIIALVLICSFIGTTAEPSCTPQFKCFVDTPLLYQISGVNFNCPVGFVCNADYDLTSCDPCVALNAATCGFSCTSATGGEFTLAPKVLRPFACPTGQVCNAFYDTCAPCNCLKAWTCNVNKPNEFTISGLGTSIPCGAGQICNKDYQYPCTPCIPDITQPVTTTTTTPAPIWPPAQYPPNCNDGLATKYRCRPGPPGSGYYYKCRPVGMVFDFDVKLCTGLASDSCRDVAYILLLYLLVLSCIGIALVPYTNCEPLCNPQFTCYNTSNYQILGYNGTCPLGTVCNKEYTDDCNPCVVLSPETCQFKCDPSEISTALVNISGTEVAISCSNGQVCNSAYMDSCAPCVEQVCDSYYKCNPNKNNEVFVSGLTIECRDRKVCNKDYKYPCDVCVDPNPAILIPPNCNDQNGYSNPCRPGPVGSRRYYKCKKVGKFYFDYEEKNCLFQFLDGTCKRNKQICT